MDIVASVGYVGQSLFFIDEERFAHTTGKGIYIYDTHKGPREIVWRHDKEMQYCSVNLEAQLLTFSFKAADQTLELVKLTDINTPLPIENPCKSAIIHHEITRTGDRLYGLSDVSDHQLLVWSVSSKSVSLITSKSLTSPCKWLTVNPCDKDIVCLYGRDGVFLAQVREIFNEYSLKIQKLYPVDSDKTDKSNISSAPSEESATSFIQFVQWLPFHRLLIGLDSGEVLEVNTESNKTSPRSLGKFLDPTLKTNGGTLIGTTALVTSSFLVLGTKTGTVYWYNLGGYLNDISATTAFMEDMKLPIRVAPINAGPISSLVVDPSFGMLVIGTTQGTIAKAKVDPEPVDPDANKNNNDPESGEVEIKQSTSSFELVNADPFGNQVKTGLIFASKFSTLNVKKITTRAKSSLSLLFLGSHDGTVSIWRQNEQTADMVPSTGAGTAIRRSNPKATEDILRIPTRCQSAIVALEVIPYGYFYLLCLGFENGYVEFWSLFGCEFDEEEAKEVGNSTTSGSGSTVQNPTGTSESVSQIQKCIEDDEGSCIVKLEAQYLMKNKIFKSSFDAFTVITKETSSLTSVTTTLDVLLGVTSVDDAQCYLIHVIKDNKLELGKVLDVYDPSLQKTVDLSQGPEETTTTTAVDSSKKRIHSIVWMEDTLYTFQGDKAVVRHKLGPETAGKLVSDTTEMQLEKLGKIAKVISSPLMNSCVVLNEAGIGYYLSFSSEVKARMNWQGYKTRRLQESRDLISIASYAPNGILFATGLIDGSVVLWKIDPETFETVTVVHTAALYACPLTNLTFSVSSASLYTSAVDGTSMILFIGRANAMHGLKSISASFSQPAVAAAGFSGASLRSSQSIQQQHQSTFYHVETLDTHHYLDSDLLLQEKLFSEKEKELKASYKFKTMGITAAINEIAQRLQLLIEQNDAREPLEQLPLKEFVLNLSLKRQQEEEQQKHREVLQKDYFRANKYFELLAARVKAYTYDTIEQQAVRVRPFLSSPDVEVSYDQEGVASFPILKISKENQQKIEKIKRLRRLEIRTMKNAPDGSIRRIKGSSYYRCAWSANVKDIPTDLSYVVNEGTLWPLSSNLEGSEDEPVPGAAAGNAANKKDAAGNNNAPAGGSSGGGGGVAEEDEVFAAEDEEEDLDLDDHHLLNLFYSPLITRSIIQKRNQIFLLQEIITEEKKKFNQTFSSLKNEKEETVQQMEAKLSRMEEILAELQIEPSNQPEYQQLLSLKKLYDDEIANSVFTVHDWEIEARPYETEAIRLQKQKELEEKLKKMQNNAEEALKDRALQDMMFGTLEMKKNLLLNEDLLLQKPEWMNELTDLSQMNEAQVKEYEAYQAKVKQLLEEQAHYKKTLEQEMKKLKLEMIELSKSFNEKIYGMIQKKLMSNKVILANEIYISRIALTMVRAEQSQGTLKRNDGHLLTLRQQRIEMKQALERYHHSYEEMKNKLQFLSEEEKNMDKTFKRDLQNLCNNTFDIESLKVFTDLYRKRIYPKVHLSVSLGDGNDEYNDRSESMDISASQSQARGTSATAGNAVTSGTKKSKEGGKLGTTKANASSRGPAASRRSAGGGAGGGGGNRRLKASRGVNASKETSGSMGPMQQAAQALLQNAQAAANNPNAPINPTNHLYENDLIIARERDPFYTSLIAMLKKKKKSEVLLPVREPLRLELDCPEGFVVDQFSWAKLQELRTQRIEKEIEKNLVLNDVNHLKTKLAVLEQEEYQLNTEIGSLRSFRDQLRKELKELEINLDLMVHLLQGQDEMNCDAMVTDYGHGLLLPVNVIMKYNTRIKELGLEKINILTKIKLFRRKMNLIHWEAIHNTLQLKHYEQYYTDIQLFRVTRDLQKVILEGENAFNQKERCDKIQSRKEFLSKDYQVKQQQLMSNIANLQKQLEEKDLEIQALKAKIFELANDVQLAKSIKDSKESKFPGSGEGGGAGGNEDYINKKMKKIKDRRHMVDIARAQAEEIDFLRQELDRMRQRTFPSFVKATKNRVNSMY